MSPFITLESASVATPVLEWLTAHQQHDGRVVWAGRSGAYLRFDDFVLAISAIGIPRVPNGAALYDTLPATVCAGMPARVRAQAVDIGAVLSVRLDGEAWEPRPSATFDERDLAERGAAIVRAVGLGDVLPVERAAEIARRLGFGGDREGHVGSGALLRWLLHDRERDARLASARLIGRGPGLTPVGDDLIAGVAFARAVRRPGSRGLRALSPRDVARRTNALAATLLRLAVQGRAIEPAIRLVDPGSDLHEALTAMDRFGRTTGGAYAIGIGIALAPGWSGTTGWIASGGWLDESPSPGFAGDLTVLHDDPAA